jgi:hypothetical protein
MMKSFALALFAFAFAASAQAASKKFACANVNGVDEWTIYIDLNKRIAGFFDNDSTFTIPLTNVRTLESLPPQTLYTFEGKDSNGNWGGKIRISFNITRRTAFIVTDVGTDKEESMQSKDGCEVNNQIDIDLE